MNNRIKDISIIAGLTAVCAFLTEMFYKTTGLLSYDEGMLLNAAAWVNKGLIPFKDYIYLINMPGHSYIISLFFKIFGVNAFAGRVSVVVMFTMISILVYLILKHIIARPFALAGALFYIATIRFTDWYFPYPSWYAMPFAVLAVYLSVVFLEKTSAGKNRSFLLWLLPFAGGLSSATAFFSKQNIGFLNFLAIFFSFLAMLILLGPGLRKQLTGCIRSVDMWLFLLFYSAGFFLFLTGLFIYFLVNGAFLNLAFYCFRYPFIYAGGETWSSPQMLFTQIYECLIMFSKNISLYGYFVLASCAFLACLGISRPKYRGIFFISALYAGFSFRNLLSVSHPFSVLAFGFLWMLLSYALASFMLMARFFRGKFAVKEAKILLLLFMAVSFVGHLPPHWIEIHHHALARFPSIMLWLVLLYELFVYSKNSLVLKADEKLINNTPYMILVLLTALSIINPLINSFKGPLKVYNKNAKFPTVVLEHPRGKVYVWDYVADNTLEILSYLKNTVNPGEEFLVFPMSNMLYFFMDKNPPVKIFEFLPRNGPLSDKEFIRIMQETLDKRIKYCIFDGDPYIGWQMPQIYPLYNFFNGNYRLKKAFKNFRVFELREDAFGPVKDFYKAEKLFEQAKGKYYAGNFKEADKLVDQAIQLDPQDARFYYFRGTNIRDWVLDNAARTALGILDASSSKSAYLTNRRFSPVLLGDTFFKLGMYDEAVMEYATHLASKGDDINTRYEMAVALENAGRMEEAVLQYGICMDKNPGFEKAREAVKRINSSEEFSAPVGQEQTSVEPVSAGIPEQSDESGS